MSTVSKMIIVLVVFTALMELSNGFIVPAPVITSSSVGVPCCGSRKQTTITKIRSIGVIQILYSSNMKNLQMSFNSNVDVDPMEEATMDTEAYRQLEKQRKAQLLREQEVFMKKSTGKHKCTNCDWEYDETKGDVMMIGGMVQPGTKFEELASNWRCPVCRASKDKFQEVVEEIPGFEVNQGYGFGTNSWTAGQKNLAIFGGLGFFFLLFLSGYALS